MDAITIEPLERTRTLVLIEPITVGAETYSELMLREPTAQAMENAEKELGSANNLSLASAQQLRRYQVKLVAGGARVSDAVVWRMYVSQVNEASDFLLGTFNTGPSTGAT
jgi:Phage tail assembly chaperone proteins, E, or 41 or 14